MSMNASQEKNRTLYHLEDLHDEPSIQEGLAHKIKELHQQGKIQAVFCENYKANPEPIDSSLSQKSNNYLSYLAGEQMPIYGAENQELHKKHIDITQRLYATRKTRAIIRAQISEKERKADAGTAEISDILELQCLVNSDLKAVVLECEALIVLEAIALVSRTNHLVNYAVEISNQCGYDNIALVCGREHREAIRERSEQLGFSYKPVMFPMPETSQAGNEAFLRKLFKNKESMTEFD
jgi:hypothetical protein